MNDVVFPQEAVTHLIAAALELLAELEDVGHGEDRPVAAFRAVVDEWIEKT